MSYILATDRVALAIREGRQTQDRRPVKGKPSKSMLGKYATEPYKYLGAPWQPGDLLYVREASQQVLHPCPCRGLWDVEADLRILYRADSTDITQWCRAAYDHRSPKWRPNIHMPKAWARTWVRVRRVWVERVRDISEADCLAEGVDPYEWSSGPATPSARGAFAELWESLYPGSWKRNDWVWCCEFEREEQGR